MVLDIFTIVFEADTSSLEKGTKKSENQTEKLNKKLKETDKNANSVGQGLKGLLATGLGALTAIASFSGIAAGIFNTALYSDELAKNSKLLGENINTLAAYQDLATKAGGSADGMTAVFKNLNGQISEFAIKGTSESLPYFQKLGIALLDSEGKARKVSDILPELADKFSKMSNIESAGLGRKLGLDEGTITLLQAGRRELETTLRKQKSLFSITKEQAKISEDFNDTMHDTKTAFRGLFLTIGGSVLPVLQFLLEKFQKVIIFLRENGHFAKGLFIALGVAISSFVIPALVKMAIASVAAFAPFYLVGAVVAGLITLFTLLFDDIMTFLDGGESAFGGLLKWLGMTVDQIENVRKAFSSIGDLIGGGFSAVGKFFGIGGDDKAQAPLGQLSNANSNPINNAVSNSSNVSKSSNVKIDKVEVITQSTDPESISRDINKTLSLEIANANNNFDDGIQA